MQETEVGKGPQRDFRSMYNKSQINLIGMSVLHKYLILNQIHNWYASIDMKQIFDL